MRRTVDVVIVLVLSVVALPVTALVSLAVLISLGRPVLFRQERAGLDGRTFRLVKFRTMRPAREYGEVDETRTPALGRVMRASSLDELPQLWNILRGDMALIGPRPALPLQVEHYSEHQRGRLRIRPGLTGWAQVNGRNAIGWPERIELDLWYIGHRSAGLDARILFLTALRLVRPAGVRGAAGINEGFRTASGTVVDVWGDRPAVAGDSIPAARSGTGADQPGDTVSDRGSESETGAR